MTGEKTLLIIGTGGLAREISLAVAQINAEKQLWDHIGFVSELPRDVGRALEFGNIVGTDEWALSMPDDTDVVIGIGIPRVKAKIVEKYTQRKLNWPNVVDPSSSVDTRVVAFGRGNVVTAGCVFTCGIKIGSFNLFNLNCTISHDAVIGDGCVINPSANISGGVTIGNRVLCGVGCQILEGLTIGDDVTIGAGAVVVKDVPDGQTVVGVPARPISASTRGDS